MDFVTISSLLVTALLLVFGFLYLSRSRNNPLPSSPPLLDANEPSSSPKTGTSELDESQLALLVLYGTQTGTSARFAGELGQLARTKGHQTVVRNLVDFDLESFVNGQLQLADPELNNFPRLSSPSPPVLVFVVSTYSEGTAPNNALVFETWLQDLVNDFRVPRDYLSSLSFGVFGCGNSLYGSHFNAFARRCDNLLRDLQSKRLGPVGLGDVDSGRLQEQFDSWSSQLLRTLKRVATQREKKRQGTSCNECRLTLALLREQARLDSERIDDTDEEASGEEMHEVEDLSAMPIKAQSNLDSQEIASDVEELRPMLNPMLRSALSKQGYKLIGTHSGVKLCRWTKSMLRGRGGCYKHTFYGIASYQCMEMTPRIGQVSPIFQTLLASHLQPCMRQQPVGTHWKWETDEPEFLINNGIEQHQKMIKQMKGVPGVREDRFEEAMTIRHCALSLVGEPIIYPHINRFVDLLHERNISSFMVTNAQFPDKLRELKPVTQLYLSIDAATPESLHAVDRPLFKDFWERHLASIEALRDKQQRTVFRLTLVKEYNMEEVAAYAKLVLKGNPDFIEVKGVTYCGKSDASPLTIKSTPFHEEVISFCKALCEEVDRQQSDLPKEQKELLAEYAISCEHEHSLCVLISNKHKYLVDGQWYTWIDYDKFIELVRSGESFKSEDYRALTPEWAVYGSDKRGFDPEDSRFRRKNQPTSGC